MSGELKCSICCWCGDDVHEEEELCSVLNCQRNDCDRNIYHLACVEDHLRKQGLPPGRMAGFQCPRGLGKYTNGGTVCRGKIESTHRIIHKNKKKKAAACAIVAPPIYVKPTPKPKPKMDGIAAAQAAAARLSANRPVPVRAGAVPGGASKANAGTVMTPAQQREIKALCLQELGIGAVGKAVGGRSTAASAAQPAFAAGSGAALRLGENISVKLVKGRKVDAQQACIPGMEPVEQKPRVKSAMQPKLFNLQEDAEAFPTLGNIGNATPFVIKATHEGLGAGGPGDARLRAINTLDPNDIGGFITNLEIYNKLCGDEEVEEVFDGSGLSDDQLLTAVRDGLEAAGLPPEAGPYVECVRQAWMEIHGVDNMGFNAAFQVLEQQQEDERVAYAAAEQVVMAAELAEVMAAADAAAAVEEAAQVAAANEAKHVKLAALYPVIRRQLHPNPIPQPSMVTAFAVVQPVMAPVHHIAPHPVLLAAPVFVMQQPGAGVHMRHATKVLESSIAPDDCDDDSDVDVDDLLALLSC